jgi:hypothetical protein
MSQQLQHTEGGDNMAKKTLTLHPSYATPNTVCFKEDGAAKTNLFAQAAKPNTFLGSFYLKGEQLEELGWVPESVGDEYETAPDRRGKTYTRADVTGPSINVSIEVA